MIIGYLDPWGRVLRLRVLVEIYRGSGAGAFASRLP